jgi:mannosyltransferase
MMSVFRTRIRSVLIHLPQIGNPIWLALILIMAIALRLYRIGANSLWFDEAFSWLVARQPAWAILTQRLEPILPPLYHFLLHFWIFMGESEAVLRSFSAVCGVLVIPVIYFLGREISDSATGVAAALLIAVLPFHVYFAQEARLYALVILLSALMLLMFVRVWKGKGYGFWIGFGVLVGLSFYAHYFVIFSLAVLHGFVFLARSAGQRRWPGLLLADMVAMVVVAPHLLSAWAQAQQVTSNFWLPVPSPLQPIKTLDYLLFSHTTPPWLVPVALFLTLSIITLVTWAAFLAQGEVRKWLPLLLALVLGPIFLALILSWLVGPVYLDRSFSLVTPAYVLLLGWGMTHPPRSSPLPLLFAGLLVVVVVSLGNHYLKPDPAKPSFRDVGGAVRGNWLEGDALLHLHDSSYLPLRYYAPKMESYLLNNDPDTWIPAYTWEWAGQRTSSLDEVVVEKSRLWVLVMPDRLNDRQTEVLAQVESRYRMKREWTWSSIVDPIKLRLYSLGDVDARNTIAAP